jgi:hypothetical protein
MKKIALLLLVFFLHVEASDDTQVGTFDTGVSSEKPKIGKKYKAPIEEAKTYQVDINESEIEGITSEPPKPKVQKEEVVKQEKKEELIVAKKEPIKIEKPQNSKSDVSQNEGGGVVLPYDKVDEKSGVVLPMDEEKKGGFFSIFGF